MCSPTALAATTIIASVAATGVTVYGQEQAASAAQKQANYNAAVARNNAVLANRAAQDAVARGKQAEQNAAIQGDQLISRERTVLAANGVDLSSKSAVDIQSSQAGQNKLAQLTIRGNAQREALGFETQGMNYQSQAQLDELVGANTAAADRAKALGSLLNGGATVASKWYTFNQAGVFG